jgi:undecaprenyl-diphosphatase
VLALGSLHFLRTRHLYSLALLWLSLLGARVLNQTLKGLFVRPRPQLFGPELEILGRRFDYPKSYSFPSGHAVTAVVLFGTLAYLIVRLEPTVRMRRITLTLAALLILLIGLSRMYLGVHYPSDVLAGYLAGFIWSTFAAFTIEVVRYFLARKPEVVREEQDLEKGLRPLREAVRGETSP